MKGPMVLGTTSQSSPDLRGLKVSPDLIDRVIRDAPLVTSLRDARPGSERPDGEEQGRQVAGVTRDGQREVTGRRIAENAGAKFRLPVMNEPSRRHERGNTPRSPWPGARASREVIPLHGFDPRIPPVSA